MSKLASLIKLAARNPESRAAALATAATTGITIAKVLGKRSIYGAVAGVGISLLAKKFLDKQVQNVPAKDDIIDHEPVATPKNPQSK